jgi:hypothetical protein
LCIHTIDIRCSAGVSKKLAEHRAQICLLGLKEIQKYWKINDTVLDLFFQCLDESTVQRLLNGEAEHAQGPAMDTAHQNAERASWNARATRPAAGPFIDPPEDHAPSESSDMAMNQDQFLNMPRLSWRMEDIYRNTYLYVSSWNQAADSTSVTTCQGKKPLHSGTRKFLSHELPEQKNFL